MPEPPPAEVVAPDALAHERAILENAELVDTERLRDLRRRISLEPERADLHAELGELYFSVHLRDLAEFELLHAVRLDDELALSHLLLGEVYRSRSDHGRSLWHFERSRELRGDDPQLYYLEAKLVREVGDLETAGALVTAGLELAPEDGDLLVMRGVLALDRGDAEAALAPLVAGLVADPDHLRGHMVLGNAYLLLDRETEARAAFDRHERNLLLNQEGVLHREEPVDEALRAAILARRHLALGLQGLAREELERSFAAEPDNPAALRVLACLHWEEAREGEALEVLERARALAPEDVRVAVHLALYLLEGSAPERLDPGRASKLAAEAIQGEGRRDSEAWLALGMARAALGAEGEARQALTTALQLNESNVRARRALASLDATPAGPR